MRMRLRQSAVLVAAAATGIVVVPVVPAAAAAPDRIYVDGWARTCTDSGAGTLDQPFCSIGAAAAVVQPGQTVRVSGGQTTYQEAVHLTRSGTPDHPIVFDGSPGEVGYIPAEVYPEAGTESALTLDGVHDVVIRGFDTGSLAGYTGTPAVVVKNSSRVTLDDIRFSDGGAAVGGGDGVTVGRSSFVGSGGLEIGAGTQHALVTANLFHGTRTTAVKAADVPGVAVTNNTVAASCGESVRIDGTSPGAVVENNVITAGYAGSGVWPTCTTSGPERGETEIAVSAASTDGTRVDYNSVHPWSDANAYTWGGTSYPTPAAFRATGQGAHDIDTDVTCANGNCDPWLFARSAVNYPALADSADPAAPGIGTDLAGRTYTDNPNAADTLGGVRDRGAFEATGQRGVNLAVTSTQEPTLQGSTPLTVTATADVKSDWPIQQSDYLFDFGDGTKVHSTTPTATHVYDKAGTFATSLTVTDTHHGTARNTGPSVRTVVGQLSADPTVSVDGSLYATVRSNVTTPWRLTGEEIDFGDGSPKETSAYGSTAYHQYMRAGDYQLTVTDRDDSGKTLVTKRTVHAVSPQDTATLQPGKRVQLLTRDGKAWLNDAGANYDKGVWGPFLPVPGAGFASKDVASMASVTTADQYLRAFALADGKVYSADRRLGAATGGVAQGQWLPWSEVTGANGAGNLNGITQISAAASGNWVHVLALAGGRVYEASGDRASGTWSKWGDITAALGFPANTVGISGAFIGNVLHVGMTGSDGHVRVGDGDYDRGRWSGGDLTDALGYAWPSQYTKPSQIGVAATADGKLHLFVVVWDRLMEAGGDYTAGRWTNWADVYGATGLMGVNRVGVAATGNTLRVFTGSSSGTGVTETDADYAAGRWSRPMVVGGGSAADLFTATGF